ncbi:hypothetical protein BD413DRAFT_133811 [Trametes elegans]|nr:hypothetical protein BD413DRAFT_133811 [Trametes elegans]
MAIDAPTVSATHGALSLKQALAHRQRRPTRPPAARVRRPPVTPSAAQSAHPPSSPAPSVQPPAAPDAPHLPPSPAPHSRRVQHGPCAPARGSSRKASGSTTSLYPPRAAPPPHIDGTQRPSFLSRPTAYVRAHTLDRNRAPMTAHSRAPRAPSLRAEALRRLTSARVRAAGLRSPLSEFAWLCGA